MFRPQLSALRNEIGRGRSVDVALHGTKSNRFGVGARAVATYSGKRNAREMVCGGGYLSGQPMEFHFGLGDAAKIDTLEITWPSGTHQTVVDLQPGRVTIDEERGVVEHAPHRSVRALPPAAPERIAQEGDGLVLTATDLDGNPFVVMPKGPLVLHFWIDFCASCDAELKAYDVILGELLKVDPAMKILSLNVDGDADRARKARRWDRSDVVPLLAGDRGRGWLPTVDPVVPLIVVVGTDGIVRGRHVGALSPVGIAALARRALR